MRFQHSAFTFFHLLEVVLKYAIILGISQPQIMFDFEENGVGVMKVGF